MTGDEIIAHRIGVCRSVLYVRARDDETVRTLLLAARERERVAREASIALGRAVLAPRMLWAPLHGAPRCHICARDRFRHEARAVCSSCWSWWKRAGRHLDESAFPAAVWSKRRRLQR